MTQEELKLKFVANTIHTLEKIIQESNEHAKYYVEHGLPQLANYYEGKAFASSLAVELLKKDLEDF